MAQWQGRSRATPLGYRIMVFVARNLGMSVSYFILRFIAFYYLLFSRDSTRVIYDLLKHRLKFDWWYSVRGTYRNYYIFAQTLLDKIVVMAGIENKLTYEFDGEENLREIVSRGKGGILISAHVGNWEAAGHLLKRLNTRINVVMYDGEQQQIKEYLESVTGKRNLNVILVKPDLSHVYAMGEALQNNELICLHADRFLEGNKTVKQEFLGEEANFPLGPFILAASFKAPVSLVFAFKETRSHYHFFGSPILQSQGDESKSEFRDRLLRAFVEALDQKVKMYPEQWFNYFNFWAK
ncbi:MAG: lipid A biosynthesis acyltransferase [Chryseolinea sp.]